MFSFFGAISKRKTEHGGTIVARFGKKQKQNMVARLWHGLNDKQLNMSARLWHNCNQKRNCAWWHDGSTISAQIL